MVRPPLILASASPRRVELLRQIEPEFGVVASHASELHDASLDPRRLCEVNAQRKAYLVAERYPHHLILGADTLVFLDRDPLGKPADLTQAHAMLRRLSGRIHEVITGVCLVHHDADRTMLFADSTRVKFRELSDAQIVEYLALTQPLDKAGAYGIQDHGSLIVDHIEGSFSNVVGLPIESVRRALEKW